MRFKCGCIALLLMCALAWAQDARAVYMKTRLARNRSKLLQKYGGTRATEAAVQSALRFFKMNQEEDGRWSVEQIEKRMGDDPPRTAEYDYTISAMSIDVPVTALVMLCYSGAGPDIVRKYTDTYIKALNWLMVQQKEDGGFGGKNYSNAICASALCEAYAVTGKKEIRTAAEKAINKLIETQCALGGWDYHKATDRNDTSLTAWAVSALTTAQDLQLIRCKPAARGTEKGPRYTDGALHAVYGFLNDVIPIEDNKLTAEDVYYLNQDFRSENEDNHVGSSLTAAAAYCMIKTGINKDDPRLFVLMNRAMHDRMPEPNSKTSRWYRWNYSTQAAFQMGGIYWDEWNKHMKNALLNTQRMGGPQDGSWDPSNDFATEYTGRLFATTMGCMMLETYYRFPRIEELHEYRPAGIPKPEKEKLAQPPAEVEEDDGQQDDDDADDDGGLEVLEEGEAF